MQVIKATKAFRTGFLFIALCASLASIILVIVVKKDCNNSNLKVTGGLLFILWSLIFVMLLLQMVGWHHCMRAIPKLLFAFYFFVCACMFFV